MIDIEPKVIFAGKTWIARGPLYLTTILTSRKVVTYSRHPKFSINNAHSAETVVKRPYFYISDIPTSYFVLKRYTYFCGTYSICVQPKDE